MFGKFRYSLKNFEIRKYAFSVEVFGRWNVIQISQALMQKVYLLLFLYLLRLSIFVHDLPGHTVICENGIVHFGYTENPRLSKAFGAFVLDEFINFSECCFKFPNRIVVVFLVWSVLGELSRSKHFVTFKHELLNCACVLLVIVLAQPFFGILRRIGSMKNFLLEAFFCEIISCKLVSIQ